MCTNRTSQAKCLFDHGQADPTLDHGAEMIYPGERFDADQQCESIENIVCLSHNANCICFDRQKVC